MAIEEVKAEVTGNIWKIVAQTGDSLEKEQVILIMESMKMEIPVTAPMQGTLKQLLVKEGQGVSEGEKLALIET